MTYKQCLFFVAKCLTLDRHPERIIEVKEALSGDEFDWKRVLRTGDRQYVLPAMYLQLARAGLRPCLPDELDTHLQDITSINRQRNAAIIDQAKEITKVLNTKNITPVFLKGVAHLLTGLYSDIAERLIGDIDIVVPREQLVMAAELLMAEGYTPLTVFNPERIAEMKNFPRLHHENFPAPIEIHQEPLYIHHQKFLRGADLLQGTQPVESWECSAFIPSDEKMIIHNVFNVQFNDNAYRNCSIYLRQMLDIQLLSLKTDSFEAARNYGKKFKVFNSYFAAISYVFSNPSGINFKRTIHSRYYIRKVDFFLSHFKAHRRFRKMKYFCARINRYISVVILSIFNKYNRLYLLKRLKNREFYRAQILSWARFFNSK